jgi:4-hydroxybutyrate CoA-transferase
MDWKAIYKERLITAPEAVKRIKSGNRVVIGHAVGEPTHVIDAMVANKDAYKDVEIIHMVAMGKAAYAQPGMEPHFRHNALFVGGSTRETVKSGHGDFTPCFFHRIPEALSTALKPDVVLMQVSPPDNHGFCSCGVSVDYTKGAAEVAGTVIAQVNKNMPRTLGDTFLHVSQLHCIVEHDAPIIELKPPQISDVEKGIGENCAKLIKDGDCLQLGIGAIPDAVLLFLKGKKDLGIHSEMISDGVVELVEAGVVTNAKKNFHKGVSVITFLMGTRRLYDYVDNNPAVNMFPVNYVNNPYIAGQNDNLVSVNSCVQVDFLGQVCSETVGTTQISAVGGQVDFVRATAISKGGRSIIAMPSMGAQGTVSKIVPLLDEGAAVTTSRYDVQYVVTEYGIADLRFRTTKDRARALIDIAHPNFRESLKEEFAKRFNVKY